MADWLPRKVVADEAFFRAVPAGLDAWIRYAGRVGGLPAGRLSATSTPSPNGRTRCLGLPATASGAGLRQRSSPPPRRPGSISAMRAPSPHS